MHLPALLPGHETAARHPLHLKIISLEFIRAVSPITRGREVGRAGKKRV